VGEDFAGQMAKKVSLVRNKGFRYRNKSVARAAARFVQLMIEHESWRCQCPSS